MKKQTIVFKVVTRNKLKRYTSSTASLINPHLNLKYRIGRKTIPKIGELFAFNTLNAAQKFAANHTILICKARISPQQNFHVLGVMRPMIPMNEIRCWWKRNCSTTEGFDAPNGTIFCKTITPIKVWKNHE